MKTTANVVILCAMVCMIDAAMAARVHAAPGRDQFDGKWTVELTSDDAKVKPIEDTLTFKAGKLESAKLKKEGFKEAEYEADVRGGQVQTFTASAKGTKGGTAKWTGTAAAGELTGTLVWTKADGTEATYNYKGKRAEK
jgi:hypothetical protein